MTQTQQIEQTVLGNIREQPETLQQAFADRAQYVDSFVQAFQAAPVERVVFLGSGTSFNVATLAAAYFSRIVGVEATAPFPTELLHRGAGLSPADHDPSSVLVVGISQSGTSISTCEAVEHARARGYRTFALTSEPESRITTIAEAVAPMLVGLELTGPETKGYTVSVLAVYLWALEVARATGSRSDAEHDEAIAEVQRVTDAFRTVVEESEAWYDRNRPSLLHASRINVEGYGIDYATMLEAVLKIAEMLRVPTIGNLLEEHGHGPTMALQFDHATLYVGADEEEFERMLEFRDKLAAYAPGQHVVTTRAFEGADERDLVLSVPASRFLAPLLHTVAFQLVAAKGGADVFIDTNVNPVPVRLGHYEA